MSAAQPLRTPASPSSAPSSWRPRLQIVRAPAGQRSLLPFAALCLTILVGAMLVALMLNTAMAATAYEMREERTELARMSEHQQVLAHRVEQKAAPASLATAATELGMERDTGINYLTLQDDSITGPAADPGGSDE